MNTNKYYKKEHTIKLKKIIYILVLIMLVGFAGSYELYKYNAFINYFKTNFNDYKFSEANSALLTTQNLNPFKLFMLNRDINYYFNDKINSLSEDIKNKKVSSEDALVQLNEIKRYNIIDNDKLCEISSSLDLIQDSMKNYTDGVSYYNSEQYTNSISCLKKVSSLDLNYINSLTYLKNSQNKLKESLFSYCDSLVSNDHYTDALSKLSDNSDLLKDDSELENKISDIKSKQQEYLDKNSAIAEASSHALTANISPSNINTLNIVSNTSYFINVDLKKQKTYIYKGKADNWNLIRTCSCSTGMSGEETPSGSFSIKERGDWFFSERYSQGGKYWTQITGDILFHSIPFAKDKTTVLDYTMNKPSSHGCIRLSLDDAKWIYSNITKGSKVIIK